MGAEIRTPEGLGKRARVTDLHSNWLLAACGLGAIRTGAWGPGWRLLPRSRQETRRRQGKVLEARPYRFPTKSSFGEGGPGVEVNSHGGSGAQDGGLWKSGARREYGGTVVLGGDHQEVRCQLGPLLCWPGAFAPLKHPSLPSCTPISSSVKWKSLPMECGEG